jgi:LPXTG-motif cell wall-anchored protein
MKLLGRSALTVVFTVALANATILSPTGSSPVAPSAFGTSVTGPFLANTGFQNFTATNSLGQKTITGKYEAMVYSDPGNTFCAGCLDFFVIVESNSTSTDDIERITLANFGSFLTNVGYSIGTGSVSGGVDPSTVDRSNNGNVVGFNFNELAGVPPGGETQVLEIETNAKSFMTGTLQIIDSSVASVNAFEPCSVVPEASSISLTLLGGLLLGLGFIGRRRRSAP